MMSAPGFRRDCVYLGWRQATPRPDPGPPPRRPVPADPEQLSPGWVAAQWRAERMLSRPFAAAAAVFLVLAAVAVLLGRVGLLNPPLTGLGTVSCTALALLSARVVWRGRRALRALIGAEARRVAAARAALQSQLFAAQEEHARWFRDWQASEQACRRQPQWSAVALPAEVNRIDVVGGTHAGWSALLTMIAAPRLACGGQVTVLDLTEGAAAADLVRLAEHVGIGPLVWLLPADLPRFDLGMGLPAPEFADVLAASVASERSPGGAQDTAGDCAILERVLEILGDGASIAQLSAALRALGQVGDPRADLAGGLLTPATLERVTGLFGRGAADRVVIERAWSLEARLRVLAGLGSDAVPLPLRKLTVVATDRRAGTVSNAVLGTYVTVALTHLLRQAPPSRPWRHTLCLAGAERLRADVVERLTGACEVTRTGLVLAYSSIPAAVRERLGRGHAALAVMRLGNADDAKAAAEQIGTQHRFVISQLTETVGASVSDTAGDSYSSTVGTADSWSGSWSVSETAGQGRGRGQSRAGLAPFAARTGSRSREASTSHGTSESGSLTRGISESTAWGVTTSRALGISDSLARTAQRSREFLVEPYELQQLPPSAVIVGYASPAGRQVVLADANPAILTLPTATLAAAEAAPPGPSWRGSGDVPATGSWRGEGGPPPNLGPPPEPLDWRDRRRR